MFSFIVLISISITIAFAQDCNIGSQRYQGTCSTFNDCRDNKGTHWVREFSRGVRQTVGCEGAQSNVACCYPRFQQQNEPAVPVPTPAAPQPTPAPVPAQAPTGQAPTAVQAPTGEPNLPFEKQAYLDAHNNERACYGLPLMQWDDELERLAAIHGAKCTWGHSSRTFRTYSDGKPVGENLSAGSGRRSEPVSLLNGWIDERKDFDCARNTCKSGAVCGHWTQMLWTDSTLLGCASVVCETGSPFGGGTWTNVVCEYKAAGNFNGRAPLTPAACAKCTRALQATDEVWAIDDFQVCVPNEANDNGDDVQISSSATCACPGAGENAADGACAAPKIDLCSDFEPRQCADGKTRFPKAPECIVACPEDSEGSAASPTTLTGALMMLLCSIALLF